MCMCDRLANPFPLHQVCQLFHLPHCSWKSTPTLLLGTPLGTAADPLEAERGESSGDAVPTELGRLSGIQI